MFRRIMSGYTKNIAVIRGLKSGFSADGGQLSGLVKAEKYGGALKVEVSLINFAPLTEGRYVCAVSDGKRVCVLEGTLFDGKSEVDTGGGFAALICYVNNGEVSPVASAVCGPFRSAAIGIREEIERQEKGGKALTPKNKTTPENPVYEDEALAQENYYEYEQTYKDGGTLREDKEKEADGQIVSENAQTFSAFEKEAKGGLARGKFFGDMRGEIEKVLSSYPPERGLESSVENSRWVRISYGDGKFYVFGVIYGEKEAQYICYGVPSENSSRPPESLAGMASFIPAPPESGNGGYWVMYQDASTGASVKISAE